MTTLEAELIAEIERLQTELESTQSREADLLKDNERLLRQLEAENLKVWELAQEYEKMLNRVKLEQERIEQELQTLKSDYQAHLESLQEQLNELSR